MTSPLSVGALEEARAACASLLPQVSRTFALTIPVLGEPLRTYVGIAYLLCRIADTIEDRPGQGRGERDRGLRRFAEAVRDPAIRLRPGELGGAGHDPAGEAPYERLVGIAPEVLAIYRSFPDSVREPIAVCVDEMVEGMTAFAAPAPAGPAIAACSDLEDLERYCHAVAGTVGLLLCELFASELGREWLGPTRAEEGRRFGLGLQLTNVLKDREGDDRRGITYVPPAWVTSEGTLTAEGTRTLIERSLLHLDEAQRFLLSIPPARAEMRLFCLWALHLALATLRLAAGAAGGPVKVSRGELARILETTRTHVGDDTALQALYLREREDVTEHLALR